MKWYHYPIYAYIIIGLTYVLSVSNSKYTGVYDELIGPNGDIPHHELMECGWPFKAATYWTRCTTGGGLYYTWIWSGVFGNSILSGSIVILSALSINKHRKRST